MTLPHRRVPGSAAYTGAVTLPPPITSRSNERIKALRAAFSGKASRQGELVGLEGFTLIEEAQRSGLSIETLYLREGTETESGSRSRSLQPRHTVLVGYEVFNSVVETASPQGVAATVQIPSEKAGHVVGMESGTILVLEDIQDPGNLGTLIRSADAFGAGEIIVTPACANQWSPKVIRASAGSVFRTAVRRMPIVAALEQLRSAGVRIAGAVAQSDRARPAPVADLSGSVAILIGNEGGGLSQMALEMVEERVHIPCRTESLNAAIAGSLLLYEAQRQNQLLVERKHVQAEVV